MYVPGMRGMTQYIYECRYKTFVARLVPPEGGEREFHLLREKAIKRIKNTFEGFSVRQMSGKDVPDKTVYVDTVEEWEHKVVTFLSTCQHN